MYRMWKWRCQINQIIMIREASSILSSSQLQVCAWACEPHKGSVKGASVKKTCSSKSDEIRQSR